MYSNKVARIDPTTEIGHQANRQSVKVIKETQEIGKTKTTTTTVVTTENQSYHSNTRDKRKRPYQRINVQDNVRYDDIGHNIKFREDEARLRCIFCGAKSRTFCL